MPLSTGEKLGPHEILSAIGAGGMGEVYKAPWAIGVGTRKLEKICLPKALIPLVLTRNCRLAFVV